MFQRLCTLQFGYSCIRELQGAAGEQRERKARAGACVARMRNWKVAQALAVWQDRLAYQKASPGFPTPC